ncbi:DASH family cryptochrome [Flavobacterium antarcticum]|uniref:DASH family cryptochrome n=1 Tax=Flavobacterium antarcticum TaxID=271155 RepID=UPI0003B6AA5A|nr:DASH family cryptochrome [Flavobacterium antarcticum]
MNNLVWFTNNLRVEDNLALSEACKNSGKTIAVYCFDPRHFAETKYGFKKTERFRATFLIESVEELRENLLLNNISLFVYFEKPENIIPNLIQEQQIQNVYHQKEWTSEEIDVLQNLKGLENLAGINWNGFYDQFLFHPEDIPYQTIQYLPQVFTVFRKECELKVSVRKTNSFVKKLEANLITNETFVPTLQDLTFENFEIDKRSAFPFKGGENQALKRIENYFFETQNLSSYKQTRNGLVGADYSSKLSAWLSNGSVSAKTIYWKVQEYEAEFGANEDTYWLIFELIWRDYFKYISLKFGNKIFQLDGILNTKYDWKFNQKAFNQWISGNTNEPFVNANIIELAKTGFMSNRGRQNVASFWAKEWQQDWRIAAAYFESLLIDYDVHSNYGNWIYNAGVGNDPRDRKFNIKRQAEMYDGNQEFQKLWT